MAIISQRRVRIRTIDFKAATTIKNSIFLNPNREVYIHMGSRFLWASNFSDAAIHWFDPSFDPPFLVSGFSIGHTAVGLWADDRYMWTMVSGGNLRQIDLKSQTVIGFFSLPASTYTGLTGDGRFLWTIDVTNLLVCQIDPKTGSIVGTFTVAASPNDLHFDGRFLFIFTGNASQAGRIRQYDPSKGSAMGNVLLKTYTSLESGISLTGNSRYLYATEIEEF
jgi:hypothetical protein